MLLRLLIEFNKRVCCYNRCRKNKYVKSLTSIMAFILLATVASVCVVSYWLLAFLDEANMLGENGEYYPPISMVIGCFIFLVLSHDVGYIRGRKAAGLIPKHFDLSDSIAHLMQESDTSSFTHGPL